MARIEKSCPYCDERDEDWLCSFSGNRTATIEYIKHLDRCTDRRHVETGLYLIDIIEKYILLQGYYYKYNKTENCVSDICDTSIIDFQYIILKYREIRKRHSLSELSENQCPLTRYIALIEIAHEIGINENILKDLKSIDRSLKDMLFDSSDEIDREALREIEAKDNEMKKRHGARSWSPYSIFEGEIMCNGKNYINN